VCGVRVAVARNLPIVGKGYDEFLRDLKERIRTAQIKAALAVNRELVLLYWQIGCQILARQKSEGWGTKVVEQLAKDLKSEFPDMLDCPEPTFCICEPLQKRILMSQLSSRLLDKFPGSIIVCCWTKSKPLINASGTSSKQ
jgi:hypothetical protein